MKLYRSLANGLLEAHPEDAARVIESLPEEDAVAVLATATPKVASEAVRRMAPQGAAALMTRLERGPAGAIVAQLASDLAAHILRRMEAEAREAVLDSMSNEAARSLRSLLRFPEDTAGALMDPRVLALPVDLTVQESLAHLREHPEDVRYNLYVVDRAQMLVGVLNLRELLLARKKDVLGSIAHSSVRAIAARAGRSAILAHPAWRDARSIPVVDEKGVYLGAVRYQTLRRLEAELLEVQSRAIAAPTIAALGDLYAAGIGGVLAALFTSAADPLSEGTRHDS